MPGVDAVILAGGLGTRLSSVLPGVPKILAPIKGRPFFDYVLDFLIAQGVLRIVVCVGYLQDEVIGKYQDFRSAHLVFSREREPLGTGGAVRHALEHVSTDPFVVLNGDSLCEIDLRCLLSLHVDRQAQVTVALARPDERSDVGNVWLDDESRIVAFAEKTFASEKFEDRFVNAGIYAFQRSAFSAPSATKFSLEHDLLPKLVEGHVCYGLVVSGPIIDIGTPERYAKAQSLL